MVNHPVFETLYRRLVTLAVYLLSYTYHYHIIDPGGNLKKRNRPPVIFAFRHAQIFPLIFLARHLKKQVLVSESRDGERIAVILHQIGYRLARGSTTRGGARGMLQMIHTLQQDQQDVIITPDGPKGPPGRIQSGLIYLARKTGFQIVLAKAETPQAIRLHSWDRFMIPWPGAHIRIAFSNRISLSDEPSTKEQIHELESMLQNL